MKNSCIHGLLTATDIRGIWLPFFGRRGSRLDGPLAGFARIPLLFNGTNIPA